MLAVRPATYRGPTRRQSQLDGRSLGLTGLSSDNTKPGLCPLLICLLIALSSGWGTAHTQTAPVMTPVGGARIVGAGPHDRIIEQMWEVTEADGQLLTVTNSYVEIASGLNRFDEASGQWVAASALFETTADGHLIARGTAHQVILAPDIASQPAVDLLTPDGVRLESSPLGILLFDRGSGLSCTLATVRGGAIEALSASEALARDCFEGIEADLGFRLGLASFEVDVVFRERPVLPPGFAEESTEIQVVSEWFDVPEPVLRAVGGGSPSEVEVCFGTMTISQGRAFGFGEDSPAVPVRKRWVSEEGRQFLVEASDWVALRPFLDALPLSGQARNLRGAPVGEPTGAAKATQRMYADLPRPAIKGEGARVPRFAGGRIVSPDVPVGIVGAPRGGRSPAGGGGLVLDYVTLNTSLSNYVFKGDTTYYVSGTVVLSGTTTVEGGTVIKYATGTSLDVRGPLACLTGPYRPAIFTAKLDNTIGETIASGTPTGYYAGPALRINSEVGAPACALANIRVAWADRAIVLETGTGHEVNHAQFVNCRQALCAYTAHASVRNALFADTVHVVAGIAAATVRGEHWTVNGATALNYGAYTTLYLTNSLVVTVNGQTNFTGLGNVVLTNAAGLFRAVGGGAHYLAPGSLYRNSGTTNIDAALLNALGTKTTCAPLLRDKPFALDMTLGPTARRDRDGFPDLGWHYDPLDWCWSGLTLGGTNGPATLLLTNGVAVGIYGTTGTTLLDGARLVSEGSPAHLNHLVRSHVVQEQSTNWGGAGSRFFTVSANHPAAPEVRMRLTRVATAANTGSRLLNDLTTDAALRTLVLRDCQLTGSKLLISLYPYQG